jgi:hypothetical protein
MHTICPDTWSRPAEQPSMNVPRVPIPGPGWSPSGGTARLPCSTSGRRAAVPGSSGVLLGVMLAMAGAGFEPAASASERPRTDGVQATAADTARVDAALIAAAARGDADGVRRQLAAGARVTAGDAEGRTPLLEAVILGDGGAAHIETVRLLVARGASVSLADRDSVTPLEPARRRGHRGIERVLTAAGTR